MKRGKNFYLSILERIKRGDNPTKISEDLGFSKQRLNHYIATLKKAGSIEKIGYSVWKYVKPYSPVSKRKTVVIGKNSGHSLKPNTVRGHGFMFKLALPENFRNWDKREEILKKLMIKWDPYYVGGVKRGQRITAQKTKVALTDRSIIINFPESYIAENAKLARKDAVAKFLRVVKHLERILRANFSEFGKYKFKVSRQHYALIKNSLARQYLDEEYNSKKLYVYSGRGLWLIIDNSYNLEELETIHSETAVKDNEKVQDFFNGLDMVEGYTPQFVLKMVAQNAENLNSYAVHLKSHVESVQKLGSAVQELTKVVNELKGGRRQ
jgi:hypothetical protein